MPHALAAVDAEQLEFWRVAKVLRADPPVGCPEETASALHLAFNARAAAVRACARGLLGERFGLRLGACGAAASDAGHHAAVTVLR